ncbi:MAG: ATPase [Bacteroidetes bacterium]|nr:ATPase [Bacteroidota bacterium]MBL7103523.1 ATPase [Bacteroidales bacterium]
MKKIALPVKENKLSPHFGECSHFKFYYEENGKIIKEDLIPAPPQQPELIPNWFVEKGVTDVIAAGIGLKLIEILNQQKINVFVGVKVEDPRVLVQEYLDGTLETNGNLRDH